MAALGTVPTCLCHSLHRANPDMKLSRRGTKFRSWVGSWWVRSFGFLPYKGDANNQARNKRAYNCTCTESRLGSLPVAPHVADEIHGFFQIFLMAKLSLQWMTQQQSKWKRPNKELIFILRGSFLTACPPGYTSTVHRMVEPARFKLSEFWTRFWGTLVQISIVPWKLARRPQASSSFSA